MPLLVRISANSSSVHGETFPLSNKTTACFQSISSNFWYDTLYKETAFIIPHIYKYHSVKYPKHKY